MDIAAVELLTGVWVLTLATMGAGAVGVGEEDVGWVTTLTLYLLLVIMVLFLLSGTFALGPGAFQTLGLVLGWAGHGWDCCRCSCCSGVCHRHSSCDWVWGWGLGFRPSFPSNSK